MKAFVTSMLSIAATIAAMTACTSESDPINGIDGNENTPIEFSSSILGIVTKAAVTETSTGFDNGEAIGITMYKGDAEPTAALLGTPSNSNVSFTVGDNGKLAETATIKTMYWERGKNHYFYAYYPIVAADVNYTHTAATGSIAEQITVKAKGDGSTTDLLMGNITTGLEFSGSTVAEAKIAFTHKLSKIKFIFKKDNSFAGTGKLTNISITLDKDAITYDLVNQNGTANGNDITLVKDGISTSISENSLSTVFGDWSPIVIPGATISKLALTIDGTALTATNLTASLVEGQITTITITLKGAGISELTSEITPWGTEQTGSGDII